MKIFMQNFLHVLVLSLVGYAASVSIWERQENDWDYLVFTQDWPVTKCLDINETDHTTCILPENVKTWVIHGLWPSSDQQHPSYCNNSSPFVESAILDLEPELLIRWPNLISNSERLSFWKHEWEKHGTCGITLPTIADEHSYFEMGLLLNEVFNLTAFLAHSQITPSKTKLYQLSDMLEAIELYTKKTPLLKCIISMTENSQALIEVEICTNKAFEPIDCPPDEGSVFYRWSGIPYNPTYKSCEESLPTRYLPFPDCNS